MQFFFLNNKDNYCCDVTILVIRYASKACLQKLPEPFLALPHPRVSVHFCWMVSGNPADMETFVNHNVLNICIVMDRFVAAVLEQGL